MSQFQLPFHANNYTLTQIIAKGGYGTVYLAYHKQYKQKFAVKVVPLNFQSTVENEVHCLKMLHHQNIENLYECFEQDEHYFIIFELCERTLENELKITTKRGLDLFIQVCQGVKFCHENNIAHRDINAKNVMIDCNDNAKLIDFGLSMEIQPNELIDKVSGSLVYMSPELTLRKPYSPYKADIWALGVLLYLCLYGRIPWTAKTQYQLAEQIRNADFTIPEDCPIVLKCLIMQMLNIDPSNRPNIAEVVSIFEKELMILRMPKMNKSTTHFKRHQYYTSRIDLSRGKLLRTPVTHDYRFGLYPCKTFLF